MIALRFAVPSRPKLLTCEDNRRQDQTPVRVCLMNTFAGTRIAA